MHIGGLHRRRLCLRLANPQTPLGKGKKKTGPLLRPAHFFSRTIFLLLPGGYLFLHKIILFSPISGIDNRSWRKWPPFSGRDMICLFSTTPPTEVVAESTSGASPRTVTSCDTSPMAIAMSRLAT